MEILLVGWISARKLVTRGESGMWLAWEWMEMTKYESEKIDNVVILSLRTDSDMGVLI